MKKLTLLLVSLTLLFAFASCSADKQESKSPYDEVDNIENVSAAVKEGTLSPTGLTLVITDGNEVPYTYGEWYVIEKKSGGSWYTLPVVVEGEYGFNDIGYVVTDGKLELDVDWEWLYGPLDPGSYRIVKSVYDEGNNYYFTAEFEIK
jgi:hypothetical protein